MSVPKLPVLVAGCSLAASLTAAEPPKLSADAYARARAFIHSTARPLDRALFAWRFENGSRDAVIRELAKFQNPDGGFASRLEPDVRWSGSSPMATSIALGILNESGVSGSDEHLRAAVRYLLSSFDASKGYWPALPREVNSASHAPWWHFDESKGRCEVESPVYPSAAIAAHLGKHAELLPEGLLDRVNKGTLRHVSEGKANMADLAILSLIAGTLPADAVAKIRSGIAAVLVRDPKEWTKYNAQPLIFAQSPGSPLYQGMERETALHLDYVIANQEADGGWALNWTWRNSDPAWEAAKKEWRGQVAMERLLVLRAFGRIEGAKQ